MGRPPWRLFAHQVSSVTGFNRIYVRPRFRPGHQVPSPPHRGSSVTRFRHQVHQVHTRFIRFRFGTVYV